MRARHAPFEFDPVGLGDVAGAQLLPILLGVGAGAGAFTAPLAVQHRPGGEKNRRQVHADGAHQKARCGLVAAAHQHHTVDRVRAQQFLALHRQEVAVHHGAGLDHHFAQRQGGHLDRMPAGRHDAALDRLSALAQVGVAGRNVAPGVDDADHRLAHEVFTPQAGLLQALAVAEAAEVVGGEPALAAQFGNRACHRVSLIRS